RACAELLRARHLHLSALPRRAGGRARGGGGSRGRALARRRLVPPAGSPCRAVPPRARGRTRRSTFRTVRRARRGGARFRPPIGFARTIPSVSSPVRSRRDVLRIGAVALAGALALGLSACAPDAATEAYLNGEQKAYTTDDFRVVEIPADRRGEP